MDRQPGNGGRRWRNKELVADEHAQFDMFLDDYRRTFAGILDGLTDEQVRRRLVPSATTLLGLVKHVTWMQRVWFEECIGGTPRAQLGLPQSVEDSFALGDDDTIAGVVADFEQACRTARTLVADSTPATVVTGHPSGTPRTVRWVYLQVLRELAHHCGHADILREQVLAA